MVSAVLQGFSDQMFDYMYDSNGVQYSEVVREHQLGTPVIGLPGLQLPLPSLPGLGNGGVRLPGTSVGPTYATLNPNQVGVGVGGASISLGSAGDSTDSSISGSVPNSAQYDAAAEQAAFIEAAQRKVLFLVTPKLAAFAREYYGCPDLPGAPADALTEGSHWRQANINVSGPEYAAPAI